MHDDAVRRRLLEVTGEVVSTAGADAVTVRDVAARAGTSASAVYALFGSRDALLAAVADEGFARFGAHLAAVPRTDDPGADLLGLGLAYRRSALADPHFYRVMFAVPAPAGGAGAPETPAPVPSTERPTFAVLRDAVGRVLSARAGTGAPDGGWPGAGAGRPGAGATPDTAVRAEEVALMLWALVHGLVSLELAGLVPGTADERTDRYVRALRTLGGSLLG